MIGLIPLFGLISGLAFIYLSYKFFRAMFKHDKNFTGSAREARIPAIIHLIVSGISNSIIMSQAKLDLGTIYGANVLVFFSFAIVVASFFGNKGQNGNSRTPDKLADTLGNVMRSTKSKYDDHRSKNDGPMFGRVNQDDQGANPGKSKSAGESSYHPKNDRSMVNDDFYSNLQRSNDDDN